MKIRPGKSGTIYDHLERTILDGDYTYGQQVPTDMQLCEQFGASRPTVAKALKTLETEGLVERKVGSGTYVTYRPLNKAHKTLGLVIPGLGETEIFEPICGHIAELADDYNCRLIWGGGIADPAIGKATHALQVCKRYVENKVDGVFFAPLELIPEAYETNQLILKLCKDAGLRVVLLDRDVAEFPSRSNLDLVGIDNVHAAFLLTNHLLDQGCTSLVFLSRPASASTIRFRIQGFQSALLQRDLRPEPHMIQALNPGDKDAVNTLMAQKPDGIICANDATAAELLQTLNQLNVNVPNDLRLAGFDDVKYSRLLSPPLTTVRQPCSRIAAVALDAMSMRLEKPGLPARSIRLNGELVIRESSNPTVN